MADEPEDQHDELPAAPSPGDDVPGRFPPGRFPPGRSPNPGGRPKGARRIAREAIESRAYTAKDGKTYAGPAAMMHVLIDIATDTNAKDRDRKEAAKEVLDRTWGKAPLHVNHTDMPTPTIPWEDLTDEQVDAELARLEAEEAAEDLRLTALGVNVARFDN